MKLKSTLKLCLVSTVLPLAAWAQTNVPVPSQTPIEGAHAGDRELTFGGSGATNNDFNDSFGGLNAALGFYANDTQEWLIRQSVNYSNPSNADQVWNGSTRLAFDQHLTSWGRFRPFLGLNAGRVYGETVHDSWAAGLEGGAKVYVQPRTFVFGLVEYAWNFDHGSDIDNRFRDGQYQWSLGVGFNF